jgi:hypothetical protein
MAAYQDCNIVDGFCGGEFRCLRFVSCEGFLLGFRETGMGGMKGSGFQEGTCEGGEGGGGVRYGWYSDKGGEEERGCYVWGFRVW